MQHSSLHHQEICKTWPKMIRINNVTDKGSLVARLRYDYRVWRIGLEAYSFVKTLIKKKVGDMQEDMGRIGRVMEH